MLTAGQARPDVSARAIAAASPVPNRDADVGPSGGMRDGCLRSCAAMMRCSTPIPQGGTPARIALREPL